MHFLISAHVSIHASDAVAREVGGGLLEGKEDITIPDDDLLFVFEGCTSLPTSNNN